MEKEKKEGGERPDLRRLVESAFEQREKEEAMVLKERGRSGRCVVYEGSGSYDGGVARKLRETIGGGDSKEKVELRFSHRRNEAVVERVEDYYWLLRYAAEIAFGHFERRLDRESRRGLIRKDLLHEIEHARAAAGIHGLRVRYGVGFFELPDRGLIRWVPFVSFAGVVTREELSCLVGAPSNKSWGDMMALRIDPWQR